MIPPSDGALDAAGRAELLRLLGPVAEQLQDALRDPPTVARGDWIGPASEACGRLETELRIRLLHAATALDEALATVRGAS